MKMFFNVTGKNNFINNKPETQIKNKPKIVQKKRNILPIFSLKSILNTKYSQKCGSCG
jgi:hypothetical protein